MEPRKHAQNNNTTEAKERKTMIDTLVKNRLYDSKEVCTILNVSLQSLRRAIAAGRIQTIRIGKSLRIPSAEIEKMVQGDSVLLSAQEAATMLNVSAATIRGLIKTGKIKGFTLSERGKHYKIPKAEIERIMSKGL